MHENHDHEEARVSEQLPRPVGLSRGKWLGALIFIVSGMFVFAYANAEFFVLLCQKVGILEPDSRALRGAIGEREPGRGLDVYFSANVEDGLPMTFQARRSFQRTRVNERTINDYNFVNLSNEEIYFRPVHSLSPFRAGREEVLLLEKCFCFDEQVIGPGESYTLPIVYAFTDELDDNTHSIQMNYTLFRSSKEAYDAFHAGEETEPVSHSDPGEGGESGQ